MDKRKFKPFGILGGIGPLATTLLLNDIQTLAKHQYGCSRTPDFPEMEVLFIPVREPFIEGVKEEETIEDIKKGVSKLNDSYLRGDISFYSMASNTAYCYKKAFSDFQIPLLDLHKLVEEEINQRGDKFYFVMGTINVKESELYKKMLKGKEIIFPDPTEEKIIQEIIEGTPSIPIFPDQKIIVPEDRLSQIVENNKPAIPIVACTDLCYLFRLDPKLGDYIDTTRILAKGILRKSSS